jgi:hypothetical protein
MPDYHDVFGRLLFGRIDCAIEFFRFLLKEKSEFLDIENLVFIQEIIYRKKKYKECKKQIDALNKKIEISK